MEETSNYLALVGWVDIVGGFLDTGASAGRIGTCGVADDTGGEVDGGAYAFHWTCDGRGQSARGRLPDARRTGILGGPDDIAVPVIVGYANLGDALRLLFDGDPSWLGPLWLHYVGDGIHRVKQVTEGMTVPDNPPGWEWSATLD